MKTYYVDVDGTLCNTKGNDYVHSAPDDRCRVIIDKVNALYDAGHQIIIWTARGMGSGINHFDLTRHQLRDWGVKYHELHMGKPSFDIIIDDKAMRPDELIQAQEDMEALVERSNLINRRYLWIIPLAILMFLFISSSVYAYTVGTGQNIFTVGTLQNIFTVGTDTTPSPSYVIDEFTGLRAVVSVTPLLLWIICMIVGPLSLFANVYRVWKGQEIKLNYLIISVLSIMIGTIAFLVVLGLFDNLLGLTR